jgi:Protein of unknown function (DUF4231)
MADTPAEYTPPPEITGTAAWNRMQGQQKYYSSEANDHQTKYRRIKLLLIVVSAAIPILAFLPIGDASKFIVGGAGVLIAVLEGLLLLHRYGETGITYRRTSEGLKRERALFLAGAGDYRTLTRDDALRLLAERTENLVAEENKQWVEQQMKTLEALAKAQAFAQEQREATQKLAAGG